MTVAKIRKTIFALGFFAVLSMVLNGPYTDDSIFSFTAGTEKKVCTQNHESIVLYSAPDAGLRQIVQGQLHRSLRNRINFLAMDFSIPEIIALDSDPLVLLQFPIFTFLKNKYMRLIAYIQTIQ